MDIKGKVVVITGASTGIGKATAQMFLAKWAKVIVFWQHKPDFSVDFFPVDVSDEESVKAWLEKIKSVDILINNAWIGKVFPLQEATPELVDSIFNVNFKGQLWMCKHTLPKMKDGSCIINIASIAAIKSYVWLGIYCATKAAIISMTKTLALEVAERKIRVNAIAPWAIDTPIRGKIYGEKAAKEMLAHPETFGPLKRAGKPEEIAHAAIFLAENENTTGSVVIVDWGDIL